MRARPSRPSTGRLAAAGLVVLAVAAWASGLAFAAAPEPCGGVPQITDPSKDGHHPNTDVLSAWFSEAAGGVTATVSTFGAAHVAEHDDAEVNQAAYVVLWQSGGATRYVRAVRLGGSDAVRYDYGTYTGTGSFVSAGPTTGSEVAGPGGTFTIDVPAAAGATPGTTLARPFVLTYDGVTGGVPDWVDHAPGGVAPTDPSVGADYVVGACSGPATGGTGATGGGAAGAAPVTTSAVELVAPTHTGGGLVRLGGHVRPARGGVPVDVTITPLHRRGGTTTRRVTSRPDGSFGLQVAIRETSGARAVAEGVGSQSAAVTVRSRVTIGVRRLAGGIVLVRGVAAPALPGRALLLRTTSSLPSATVAVGTTGRFTLRLRRPRPGSYQVVYIPSAGRAERSTSNTKALP